MLLTFVLKCGIIDVLVVVSLKRNTPPYRRILMYILINLLQRISFRLLRVLRNQRTLMADVAQIKADVAALDVKVDAILAVVASAPPVVATQADLDAIDAAVVAVAAKLP